MHQLIQPVQQAIHLAQDSQIDESKAVLRVSPSAISDQEFLSAVNELGSAIATCEMRDFGRAAPQFEAATSLISKIGISDTKELLEILSIVARGIYSLQMMGDSAQAARCFQAVDPKLQKLSYRYTDLASTLLGLQAIAETALGAFHFSRGNFREVETAHGRIKNIHNQIVGIMEAARRAQ